MKEFMLGCRLSVEACGKNVREKATTSFLKTTKILLDADGHVLTQGWYLLRYSSSKLFQTIATQTLDVLIFFKKSFV